MRTTTAGELATIAATSRVVTQRVKVKNGSGTWIDLSSWVESVSIDRDIDQPVDGLTVAFRRDSGATQSLSPLREDSTLNRLDDGTTFSPQLDGNREITVEIATTAIGAAIVAGDYKLLFHGKIGPIEADQSPVICTCRDLGGLLVDRWIESEEPYGSDVGVALETVMQEVLDDTLTSGFVPLNVLGLPTWPAFDVSPPYVQQRQPMMDAQVTLAQLPGGDVRYRYDEASGTFKFTLHEPPRSKTTPDHTFGPSDYIEVTQFEIDPTSVRNVITVKYPDLAAGGHLSVTVFDAASITKYDRHYLPITEPSGSPINTSAQATAMADTILWDLKDPKAEFEIDMPFFWPADLWDLFRFTDNSVHFNTNQDWAVVSLTHTLSRNHHRTKLQVRGLPAGAYLSWRSKGRGNDPWKGRPGEVGPEAKIELWGPMSATQAQVQYTATGGTQPYTYQRRLDVDDVSTGTYSAPALLGASVQEWITLHAGDRATRVFLRVIDATGLQGNADPFFLPGQMQSIEKTTGRVKRSVPFDDAKYATKASDTAGASIDSTVGESGGKLVNRLLAKALAADPDNLDSVGNGTTYGRPILGRLSSGKPFIDFSESFNLNKHGANIGRSAGDATALSTIVGHLANTGHGATTFQESGGKAINRLYAKTLAADVDNLDSVGNGTTYARPLASRISSGKPLIDFSEGIHSNKTQDYIADSASRFASPVPNATSDVVLVASAGITMGGNNATKTGGVANTWDQQVYSKEGFTGGAFAQAIQPSASLYAQFGLDIDPATSADDLSVDYGMVANGPTLYAGQSGTFTPIGTHAADDVLAVTYDGSNVRWLKNGTVLRTVAVGAGIKFFFDSSFYSASSKLNNIRFGPMSSNNAAAVGAGNFITGINESGGKAVNRLYAKTLAADADNLDSVGNGTTYARPLASRINAGKPVIDFTEAIHTGKTLDNIPNTATRFAAVEAGADKTSTKTSADTAAVSGTAAATVRGQALSPSQNLFGSDAAGITTAVQYVYLDSMPIDDLGLAVGDVISFSAEFQITGGTNHRLRASFLDSVFGVISIQDASFISDTAGAWVRSFWDGTTIPAGTVYLKVARIYSTGGSVTNARFAMLNRGPHALLFEQPPYRAARETADDVGDGVSKKVTTLNEATGGGRGFGGFTNSTGGLVSTATESGAKAVNRLFAKVLAGDSDSLDGTPDGTTYKRITGVSGGQATNASIADVAPGKVTTGTFITTVGESSGKALNRLFAKPLWSDPDTLDSTTDGTTYKKIAGVVSSKITSSSSTSRPRARVYHSVDQSIGNSTPIKLAFNSESYDAAGMHDNATSNSRLTVPAGGFPDGVMLIAHVEWASNATGYRQITIIKNNALFAPGSRIAPVNGASTIQQVTVLDDSPVADDYYEIQVLQTSGGALNVIGSGPNGSNFSAIHLW